MYKRQEVTVKVKDTLAPVFAEDTATTISTVVNTPIDDVTDQYKDKVTDLDLSLIHISTIRGIKKSLAIWV